MGRKGSCSARNMPPKQIHIGLLTDANIVNSPGARGFFEFFVFFEKKCIFDWIHFALILKLLHDRCAVGVGGGASFLRITFTGAWWFQTALCL